MLLTLVSSWLLIEKKSEILQTFPEHVQKLWYDWELQVMVILSLFFQILLILLGDRRKHIAGNRIGFIIWVAYLAADSVATYALGILSKTQQGQEHTHTNDELKALWAPFLLLHLGGPDTITAYALEDNELWLRHLLELVIQASVAFYVVFRSWTSITHPLSILTIIMFVTGTIKYGERTLALRSASKERFRDSLLGDPDPGPSYTKFVEGYVSKQDEGFLVDIESIHEDRLKLKGDQHYDNTSGAEENINDRSLIEKAHELLEIFKRLFADLILSFRDGEESRKFIQQSSSEKAFKVVEIELGFMFDVLYTKAPIVYTRPGGLLRSLCFCLTVSVFVIFTALVGGINPKKHHLHQYSKVDIAITYLLLIVAIILEIYAVIVLLSSDWVLLWPSKKHNKPSSSSSSSLSSMCADALLKRRLPCKEVRWSNSMGQNNLISFCLKRNPTKFIMEGVKLGHFQEMIEMYWHTSFKDVHDNLKEKIFRRLLKRKEEEGVRNDTNDVKGLNTSGANETHSSANLQKIVGWGIDDVEFHQSILLWHIATDLCYYDEQVDSNSTSPSSEKSESSPPPAHESLPSPPPTAPPAHTPSPSPSPPSIPSSHAPPPPPPSPAPPPAPPAHTPSPSPSPPSKASSHAPPTPPAPLAHTPSPSPPSLNSESDSDSELDASAHESLPSPPSPYAPSPPPAPLAHAPSPSQPPRPPAPPAHTPSSSPPPPPPHAPSPLPAPPSLVPPSPPPPPPVPPSHTPSSLPPPPHASSSLPAPPSPLTPSSHTPPPASSSSPPLPHAPSPLPARPSPLPPSPPLSQSAPPAHTASSSHSLSTGSPSPDTELIRDMCKSLSDYMLHLLIAHPFLLPEGIGQIRFRDTCEEAKELFKGEKSAGLTEKNACRVLLDVNTDIPPVEVKGDRSKSVLFDACRLATYLLSLETEERWEKITTVWVDRLSCAASQCKGPNHAKQLSRGGELLTHIWLLMAHLGITQQFQISQGQVRAKLNFN